MHIRVSGHPSEMNLPAGVDHVTEPLEIAKYGVFGTPAVVVDGEVKSVGKIPQKEEILAWFGTGAH